MTLSTLSCHCSTQPPKSSVMFMCSLPSTSTIIPTARLLPLALALPRPSPRSGCLVRLQELGCPLSLQCLVGLWSGATAANTYPPEHDPLSRQRALSTG